MSELPKTPSMRLDGRTALVTGAGRGIGQAAACALAQAGAHVIAVARTGSEVESLASALKAQGLSAQGHALDVTDIKAVEAFVARHGPFDVLVNNAGANRPAVLEDVTEQDYDEVSELNVRALVFISRAVVAGMRAAGKGGSIINLGSQMGHVGGPKRTVYCATKFAVEGVTKALAWELGGDGIRVNTLCPTFVKTDMTAHMLEDESFVKYVHERIALGRTATPQDMMGAFVFLASDASAMVTGSSLMVDGGWTAA